MTDTSKNWPLGSVLSLTTGVLLRKSFDDMKACANFLAGMPILTHEYLHLAEPLKEAVLAQHPNLPTETGVERDALPDWVKAQEQTFGDEISLYPMPNRFQA